MSPWPGGRPVRVDAVARASRAVMLAASVLAIAGCLTPVDPADNPVSEVRVSFDAAGSGDTVGLREVTRARAAAIGRSGFDLARTDFDFSTADADVAVVDALGVVRAVNPGTATN